MTELSDIDQVVVPAEPGRGDVIARRLLLPLLVFFGVVVLFSYVIFTAMQIDGDSMMPTLHSGDHVLRTKSYTDPRRGDIVTVLLKDSYGTNDIVKRVIGTPGDTVEIRGDVAYVNGVAENTAGKIIDMRQAVSEKPIVVPAGRVYLMGDNRPVSMDSRFIGTVPLSEVQGKVIMVFSPVTHARYFH